MYGASYYYRLYKDYEGQETAMQNRIDAVNDFVTKLKKIIPILKSASGNLSDASLTLSTDAIINGEPYDKGELGEFGKDLKDIASDFEDVIGKTADVLNKLSEKKSTLTNNKNDAYQKYLNAK